MNKRKAKKKEWEVARCGLSYRDIRVADRKSHEASIESARREHRNYWDGWDRGYPNRMRIRKILY